MQGDLPPAWIEALTNGTFGPFVSPITPVEVGETQSDQILDIKLSPLRINTVQHDFMPWPIVVQMVDDIEKQTGVSVVYVAFDGKILPALRLHADTQPRRLVLEPHEGEAAMTPLDLRTQHSNFASMPVSSASSQDEAWIGTAPGRRRVVQVVQLEKVAPGTQFPPGAPTLVGADRAELHSSVFRP